jgi:hypothetical protein
VGGREVFVAGGGTGGCIDDWPAAGAEASLGGGEAGGAGAAAPGAGVAIALTALRHGAESVGSLRRRHSKASLPPGCALAQLAMKSERQAVRTASRCAWVGCCAAVGVSVSAKRQHPASADLYIEPSLAYSAAQGCLPLQWASSRRNRVSPIFAGGCSFC